MKLDNFQKAEFFEYWGQCPLVDTTDNKVVYVDNYEKDSKGQYLLYGNKYSIDPSPAGEARPGRGDGLPRLIASTWTNVEFDNLEPLFVEPGFYQIQKNRAAWFTRKPDRTRVKGMSRHNTSVLFIKSITDKMKELPVWNSEFSGTDVMRIHYGLLPNYKSNIDEAIEKFTAEISPEDDTYHPSHGYSLALSKNVALVHHATFEIPVVMYKLKPVGYYSDKKIYLSKSKLVSRETLQEESGLPITVYG